MSKSFDVKMRVGHILPVEDARGDLVREEVHLNSSADKDGNQESRFNILVTDKKLFGKLKIGDEVTVTVSHG